MYNVPYTEAEACQLLALRSEFWKALGELAAKTLAKMPAEFHADQLMMMQDLASLYGTDYLSVLAKLKPPKRKGWAPPEPCEAKVHGKLQNTWACHRCRRLWAMSDKPPKCNPIN